MNVTETATTNAVARPDVEAGKSRKTELLKQAGQDVESLFLSILLKEGMKMESGEENEGLGNTEALHEFALEQMARELSQNGGIGIAEMIYEQLSDQ
jgi:Rod binding domain-containing protein